MSTRLKTLRAEAEWSQAELAARSGLNQATISYLESGRNQPSWEVIIALADALGVKLEAFVADDKK